MEDLYRYHRKVREALPHAHPSRVIPEGRTETRLSPEALHLLRRASPHKDLPEVFAAEMSWRLDPTDVIVSGRRAAGAAGWWWHPACRRRSGRGETDLVPRRLLRSRSPDATHCSVPLAGGPRPGMGARVASHHLGWGMPHIARHVIQRILSTMHPASRLDW